MLPSSVENIYADKKIKITVMML